MNFWNYISEFFLFRWLFSSHKHNAATRNELDTPITPADHHLGDDAQYYGYSKRYDNFHADQDEDDIIDSYGGINDYSSMDNYSSMHDYDTIDDYDMMDDDF